MTTKYKRNGSIVTANMDGETVMMDSKTGKYYNIGKIGGRIWDLLQEPQSIDDLVKKLTEEYEVDSTTCKDDVEFFIKKMKDINLVGF